MARKGPVTTDTTSIALGLAQIRVGASALNIATVGQVLSSDDSIGSLAATKFIGHTEFFRLEGGFPLIEEFTTPIREAAALECSFREISPYTLAMAYGIDPSGEVLVHSGELALGGKVAPAYIRMEALYTYPDGVNTMAIIFPRAQVSADLEMDLQSEDAAAIPIMFESKNASSDVQGGNAAWDDMPLGRIEWQDV